jgi:membrane associated rhomboid family serine protease
VTPWVRILLGANIAAFFLQSTTPWMNLFAFWPPWALTRPWTIVTYMFLHGDFLHIAFNMLGLFFFGSRVEDRLGRNRFLGLYFVSGITGALFSLVLSFNTPIIGASAGLYGVMLAFAYYWPDAQILLWGIVPVNARVLVILTTLMALWFGFGGVADGTAHFAHLGGYVGGGVFLKLFAERGRKSFRARAEGADKLKNAKWKAGDRPNVDLSKVHEINRDEVNRILDKISAKGIGSLTPQEKTFLSNFVPMDDRGIKT